ncbi:hypothetical protein EXIGLDRAFT_692325 [Exidia glandulosa HHB12029]|uniref:Uncharacterized protein n=1 Tax=Exidia glandulosa HHB12029 TaxID=1314781 RepID=A0A166BJ41_EXIGL|nr:hypothetical protein EXIGLDRAFT_692325 [Exidia glandulosa HHB12029]
MKLTHSRWRARRGASENNEVAVDDDERLIVLTFFQGGIGRPTPATLATQICHMHRTRLGALRLPVPRPRMTSTEKHRVQSNRAPHLAHYSVPVSAQSTNAPPTRRKMIRESGGLLFGDAQHLQLQALQRASGVMGGPESTVHKLHNSSSAWPSESGAAISLSLSLKSREAWTGQRKRALPVLAAACEPQFATSLGCSLRGDVDSCARPSGAIRFTVSPYSTPHRQPIAGRATKNARNRSNMILCSSARGRKDRPFLLREITGVQVALKLEHSPLFSRAWEDQTVAHSPGSTLWALSLPLEAQANGQQRRSASFGIAACQRGGRGRIASSTSRIADSAHWEMRMSQSGRSNCVTRTVRFNAGMRREAARRISQRCFDRGVSTCTRGQGLGTKAQSLTPASVIAHQRSVEVHISHFVYASCTASYERLECSVCSQFRREVSGNTAGLLHMLSFSRNRTPSFQRPLPGVSILMFEERAGLPNLQASAEWCYPLQLEVCLIRAPEASWSYDDSEAAVLRAGLAMGTPRRSDTQSIREVTCFIPSPAPPPAPADERDLDTITSPRPIYEARTGMGVIAPMLRRSGRTHGTCRTVRSTTFKSEANPETQWPRCLTSRRTGQCSERSFPAPEGVTSFNARVGEQGFSQKHSNDEITAGSNAVEATSVPQVACQLLYAFSNMRNAIST